MKTAARRTLLTLVFLVVIGVCLRYHVEPPPRQTGRSRPASSSSIPDADQPGLRVVHRGRRQSQRGGRRVVSKAGRDRRGRRRCRCSGCRASGSRRASSSTSIAPNMFAGSILDLEPDTAYEARFVHVRSRRRRRGETHEDRDGADASRADAGRGRQACITCIRRTTRARRSSRRSKGSCAPTTTRCAGDDWATAGRPRVKAGDTILVHAGVYKYNRYEYYERSPPSIARHRSTAPTT